jgi:hypothetical protein
MGEVRRAIDPFELANRGKMLVPQTETETEPAT